MSTEQLLQRITRNPDVMVGKPVIKGTRLTVDFILGLLARGASIREVLDEYQGLEEDDVRACLLFAQKSIESTSFLPLAEAV